MPASVFDFSHATAAPTLLAKAWLQATSIKTHQQILNIVNAEIYEREGLMTLDIDLMVDDTDSGPDLCSLYIRNTQCPATAWRDLSVIAQLQAITGREFASFAELAVGVLGLRFVATTAFPRIGNPHGDCGLDDLIAAAPIPEAADAPIL